MNDKVKIFAGLFIFMVFITFPIWFTAASGNAGHKPDPKRPSGETACVESVEFMRDSHMELLFDWRDEVVRNGKSIYVSTSGKRFKMSLSNTCMKCHTSKKDFCDECHDYVGIDPYCWDCHIAPKED